MHNSHLGVQIWIPSGNVDTCFTEYCEIIVEYSINYCCLLRPRGGKMSSFLRHIMVVVCHMCTFTPSVIINCGHIVYHVKGLHTFISGGVFFSCFFFCIFEFLQNRKQLTKRHDRFFLRT